MPTGERLAEILDRKLRDDNAIWRRSGWARLDSTWAAWFDGLHDAGVIGANRLRNMIEANGAIEVFQQGEW